MKDESTQKNSESVTGIVRELVEPVIIRAGMELVDVAYQGGQTGMTLRLVIDKPDGVTVDDCADVSHLVGDILDVKDPIPGRYHLEVSSPGINRPLTRQQDFDRFSGQKIYVETKALLDGRRRFKGVLAGIRNGKVRLSVQGDSVEIPLDDILKARLDIL
jgi:ribosome maturation factor RimP